MTFYLQYFGYNDENFDVDNNYFKDSNDYIKQLEENYNKTKDVIFDAMSNGNIVNDNKNYKIALDKQPIKEEKVSYAQCEGFLVNESGYLENLDDLLKHYAQGNIVVEELHLQLDEADEEFYTNWNMFVDSSNKIASYSQANVEWKYKNAPTRDIYFSMENIKNEIVYGKMVNCRIEYSKNLTHNVVIAEKIEFLKKLD